MKRCATCWEDKSIAHWHNPDPDIEPLGTSESNWVCENCYSKPANEGWAHTPSEEIYGIESEHATDTHPIPDSKPGPFETKICIDIMRRYCFGQTQRAIASDIGCSHAFVKRTIAFWIENRGNFVRNLKKSLASKGRMIQ